MAETTIEWTATPRADGTLAPGYSFNPWRGCTKVSEGCKNCYAETLSKRNPKVLGVWGPKGTRAPAAESYWREPLRWNAEAKESGERRRVFCASLADVFEGPETCQDPDSYAVIEAGRRRLFRLTEETRHLDWLLLTKRPENILRFSPVTWGCYLGGVIGQTKWPANVWIGTSVEDQAAADKRIPELLRVPAPVRFLSCEPLLGPVDLRNIYDPANPDALVLHPLDCASTYPGMPDTYGCHEGIHWVICGGESGPKARPMHPDWARSLRDQCAAAGVPFHFKQWGEWGRVADATGPVNLSMPCKVLDRAPGSDPPFASMTRMGKHASGRLLDGRTWDEFPEAAHG